MKLNLRSLLTRVVPLYKKGGRGEVGNYRPVSILPVVSKIFERIVYDQLSKHLDKHNYYLYKRHLKKPELLCKLRGSAKNKSSPSKSA